MVVGWIRRQAIHYVVMVANRICLDFTKRFFYARLYLIMRVDWWFAIAKPPYKPIEIAGVYLSHCFIIINIDCKIY